MSVSDFFVILNIIFTFFINVVFFIVNLEVALINVIDFLTFLIMSINSEVIFFNKLSECCIDNNERLSLIKIVNELIFFFIINIAYFTVFLMKLTKFSLLMQFSIF